VDASRWRGSREGTGGLRSASGTPVVPNDIWEQLSNPTRSRYWAIDVADSGIGMTPRWASCVSVVAGMRLRHTNSNTNRDGTNVGGSHTLGNHTVETAVWLGALRRQ
jgi:hypothetical protein